MNIQKQNKTLNFIRRNYSSPLSQRKYEGLSFDQTLVELTTVLDGDRPVCLIEISQDQNEKLASLMANREIKIVSFPLKNMDGGFAHKISLDLEKSIKGYTSLFSDKRYFAVAGYSDENIRKFINYLAINDHRSLGAMLGYPSCCVSTFCNVWEQGYVDPIWQLAENTDGKKNTDDFSIRLDKWYPEINPLLRYVGIRILPHIPHSFDCEASRKISTRWLEIISNIYGHETKGTILSVLKGNMMWSVRRGIAQVKTNDIKITYNSLFTYEKYIVKLV
jgi:hypothetical protein